MDNSNYLCLNTSILYRYGQKYYDKKLNGHGINAAQILFLILTYEQERLNMQQLAQKGCFDKGTITKNISHLEESGYVTTQSNLQGERTQLLYTTDKTKDIIHDIYMIRQQWWGLLSKDIGAQELQRFEVMLSRLSENAHEYEQQEKAGVRLSGIQKLILLDYPQKMASTTFTGGYSFRCSFCQNGDLAFPPENMPELQEEDVLSFLEKREGILDGVCISGGKPLLNPELAGFLKEIKDMGYTVKPDTNGSSPNQLKHLVKEGLVNCVAMDIKNTPQKCSETVGIRNLNLSGIQESITCLKEGHVACEFHITIVKKLHTVQDTQDMADWLQSAVAWYLQSFKDSGRVIQRRLRARDGETLQQSQKLARAKVPDTELRGTQKEGKNDIYQVIKRDGKILEFDTAKISNAIQKVSDVVECQYHSGIIDMLALRITSDFEPKIRHDRIQVEGIQDGVESILIQSGYGDVAKCYTLYRKQREKIRSMKSTILDYGELVGNYVKATDWRVKENSTVTYSVGGLILSDSGAIIVNYWLSEIYDEEIRDAHKSGDMHIHDLSMLTGCCAGWSLKQLIQKGLGGVGGKIISKPASHLAILCNQMVNFLGIMQNEWAGIQAFSSSDMYLAPLVKADSLNYDQVKKCVESFVCDVNISSRWDTQASFSNITLDWTVPTDLAELNCITGGKEVDFEYEDCKKEVDMVNKVFTEIVIEEDANGRDSQCPIPTYSITRNFDWSKIENNKLLFEMTARYGTPYFSDYVNSGMEPSNVRSMCCRLRLDLRELRRKSGGCFGSGESTGFVGVVTVNTPRIACLSTDKEDFYERFDHLTGITARSLEVERTVVSKLPEEGLYPYTERYLGTFASHFSTLRLIGMSEVALDARWLGMDLTQKEAQKFTKEVLNHMRGRLVTYQEEYGDLYNLEAAPAESTTYRLARHDKEHYSDIITATEEENTPYYTNSSHLPVGYTEDIFKALNVQDGLQTLYTSRTVFHAFLGEKLSDWKTAAALVGKIAENYRLSYYTLSSTYPIYRNHGYINGEHYTCPQCDGAIEVWSRITGCYRPIQNWNGGKSQKFKERKVYDIEHSVLKEKDALPHVEKEADAVRIANKEGVFLFATKTCPNRKMADTQSKSTGISYEKVSAEEQAELTRKFSTMQTSTLVVCRGGSCETYSSASSIRKYVGMMQKA